MVCGALMEWLEHATAQLVRERRAWAVLAALRADVERRLAHRYYFVRWNMGSHFTKTELWRARCLIEENARRKAVDKRWRQIIARYRALVRLTGANWLPD